MKRTICILMSLTFVACGTTRIASEANRETVRTEYRDRLRTDSVFVMLKDSVHVRERADTVFVEKFKTRIAYRDRLRVDTVSVADTVRIANYETVAETTNEPTGWQYFQIWLGRIAAGLIGVYFLIKKYLK